MATLGGEGQDGCAPEFLFWPWWLIASFACAMLQRQSKALRDGIGAHTLSRMPIFS